MNGDLHSSPTVFWYSIRHLLQVRQDGTRKKLQVQQIDMKTTEQNREHESEGREKHILCTANASSLVFRQIVHCVVRRTVLHNLSVLVICRTMQINSWPTEIIIYFWKQSGDLCGWLVLVWIKLHMTVTVMVPISIDKYWKRSYGWLGLGFIRSLTCDTQLVTNCV